MSILSLAHLTVIDASPLDLLEAAQAGGFDAIGLRLVSSTAPLKVDLIADHPALAAVKARIADIGIGVLDVEAFPLGPTPDFDRYQAALDVAAELGASRLLTTGQDADESRLTDHLIRLADIAQARGIRVGLEFIPYFLIRTVADARRILARAAHPNAGLLVDALHLSRSGGDPDDLKGLTLGDYAYGQICDARPVRPADADLPAEARTDRLPVGEGSLWLDRLLDVLPPELPLGVEAPVKAHAHLTTVERGRLAGQAARGLLARRAVRPAVAEARS
ncbi:sugar phosphate isomerase/epimerase family protein [Azospirillum endophyticum]